MRLLAGAPTERVKIIKQDQSVLDNVEALVQREKIFIEDGSLNIEEGDIIERTLPAGNKEEYLVIDRGFYKGMHGIPNHYQIKVRKQTAYAETNARQIFNTYNIGSAGKVNIQSTDNSTSTVNITANDMAIMDTLRSLAKGLENESEILRNIDEMQKNVGKPSFKEKYNNFVVSVANHMTAFGPFISMIAKML